MYQIRNIFLHKLYIQNKFTRLLLSQTLTLLLKKASLACTGQPAPSSTPSLSSPLASMDLSTLNLEG
jgi:hypothetical protein